MRHAEEAQRRTPARGYRAHAPRAYGAIARSPTTFQPANERVALRDLRAAVPRSARATLRIPMSREADRRRHDHRPCRCLRTSPKRGVPLRAHRERDVLALEPNAAAREAVPV